MTTRYYAGSNMPGYMPDETAEEFDNPVDALVFLQEDAEIFVEQLAEDGTITEEEYNGSLTRIQGWKPDGNGEVEEIFHGRCFFVNRGDANA